MQEAKELGDVLRDLRIAQTWCVGDGSGALAPRVEVTRGKLEEWARAIEQAIESQRHELGGSVEYRVFHEDNAGRKHTGLVFHDLQSALAYVDDLVCCGRLLLPDGRKVWLESRRVGPWVKDGEAREVRGRQD